MASKVEAGPAIGIDLGTTYSCVAVMRHDNVEIIPNGQGNRTTPSCVAFTQNDRLVGDAAANQCDRNPTNTVFGAKRLMGRKFSDPCVQSYIPFCPFKVVAGPEDRPKISVQYQGVQKQFYPEETSAMILGTMRGIAEAYLGTTVTNAVVTVPAYFNDTQRQTTKDAGRIAGLNIMRIINEPTSAAVAYGLAQDGTSSPKNVLVFDLGGGTFDVSLLQIKGSHIDVLATAGDTHLGGEDFDNRMVTYFVLEFERKHTPLKIDICTNPRALRRLKSAAERAKRVLSFATDTMVDVEYFHEALDFQCKISRAKFEELNLDLFSRCISVMEQCLRDAKMKKKDVHDVILVGGSTRIPRVERMLQEFFDGKNLCKSINPDEAVAHGAAVQAAKLVGQGSKRVQDLVLVDVAPLSLGVEVRGGVMLVLVPRNTPLPVKKTRNLVKTVDTQTNLPISIYEGERSMVADNNFLGRFWLNGLPPEPAESSFIATTFEIDADGVLTVTAVLKLHGISNHITITNQTGRLSTNEIESLIQEAEAHKQADSERQEKAAAKSNLEILLCNLNFRITGGNMAERMSAADKEIMANEIALASTWLEKNQEAKAIEFVIKTKKLEVVWDVMCKRSSGNE